MGVSTKPEAVQIALVHLLFNICGILIWYVIPFMRRVPLKYARFLGRCTRELSIFPLLYIIVMFILIPLILFGISSLFDGTKAYDALGTIIVIALFFCLVRLVYWLKRQGGINKVREALQKLSYKQKFYSALPETVEDLKSRIYKLDGGKAIESKKSYF